MRGRIARERSAERAGRALLAVFGLLLGALSVASAASYSSVIVAQATVSVTPRYSLAWSGTDSRGALTDAGAVAVVLVLTVDNPSPRILRFRLVAYAGWIEDGPAEAGLNEPRRLADDPLPSANGTRYYYPAISESKEIEPFEVPPRGNRSVTLTYVLNGSASPARFAAVQNITSYAAAVYGTGSAMPWNHWVRVQLTIDGVPPASSPTAGFHLQVLGLIDREEGINLAG